jgi:hypothetical protein
MFQPLTGDPNFFIDHPAVLDPNQIQSWISPPYTQGLAILHMAIYLFASLWQLHRHSIAIADVFSYREGVALSWLRRLLLALLVLLGLFVVRVFIAEKFAFVDVIDAVLNSAIVIVIYSMAYFAARQPRIFTRRIGYRALKSASSDGEPESGLPQGGEDSIEV